MTEENLYFKLKFLEWRYNLNYVGLATILSALAFILSLTGLSLIINWALRSTTVSIALPLIFYTLIALFFYVFFVSFRYLKTIREAHFQLFFQQSSWLEIVEIVFWPFSISLFVLTPLFALTGLSVIFSVVISLLLALFSAVTAVLASQFGLIIASQPISRVVFASGVLLLFYYLQTQMYEFLSPILQISQSEMWSKIMVLLFTASAVIAFFSLSILLLPKIKVRLNKQVSIANWFSDSRIFSGVYSYTFATFFGTILNLARDINRQLRIFIPIIIYLIILLNFSLPIYGSLLMLILISGLVTQFISFDLAQKSNNTAKQLTHLPYSVRSWTVGGFWACLIANVLINFSLGAITFSLVHQLSVMLLILWLLAIILMHSSAYKLGFNAHNDQSNRAISLINSIFLGLIGLILAQYV